MSKDLNQCNFIGRLGKPIELKYTVGGIAIANFSIACSDDYKDKSGNKVEQTNWINIVIFGKLAEIAGQYLEKGKQVYISGKQVTRSYDDRGNKKYVTEIVANEMQLLGGRSDTSSKPDAHHNNTGGIPADQQQASCHYSPPDDGFDSIPF